jgi:uncharacterized protein (TIGR02301 family)
MTIRNKARPFRSTAALIAVLAFAQFSNAQVIEAAANNASRDLSPNHIELSRALGEAHAIRRLCDGRSAQTYRDMMRRVIEQEGADGTLRGDRMIETFNQGYRAAEARWPRCTSAARSWGQGAARRAVSAAEALSNEQSPSS